MFALKKKKEKKEWINPTPVPPPPQKPKAVVIDLYAEKAKEKFKQYEECAEFLGYEPGEMIKEKLLLFLKQENIPVYNYEEVVGYLYKIKPNKETLYWDVISRSSRKIMKKNNSYYGWTWDDEMYKGLIPLEMLKRAKKIEEKFPEKFSFHVSDFRIPKADPFIAARFKNIVVVFGVWDEPGFSQ